MGGACGLVAGRVGPGKGLEISCRSGRGGWARLGHWMWDLG